MSNTEETIQTASLRKVFQLFTVNWSYTGVPLCELTVELAHIQNIKI